jgi:hypothetical protein
MLGRSSAYSRADEERIEKTGGRSGGGKRCEEAKGMGRDRPHHLL